MNNDITVLVTGASGFVGMHCILQLLEKGYRVKGTVRSLAKADHLRQILQQHSQHTDRLELVEANLMQDAGWAGARGHQQLRHGGAREVATHARRRWHPRARGQRAEPTHDAGGEVSAAWTRSRGAAAHGVPRHDQGGEQGQRLE